MRRALAAALLACASATPVAARAAAPDAPVALVQRYLDALHARSFGRAYALLAPAERAYFRTAANFASGFDADGYVLADYATAGERTAGTARVVFAREHVAFDDPAHGVRVVTLVTVPYLVTHGCVVDAGRPWRAFAATAEASSGGVRVTVRKVALYARAIRVVVTMQNDGAGFVTLLPYGRSVLRDDRGAVYHPIVTRDWTITDEHLFLGLRLAPNSRYTGTIAFATPAIDDRTRRFDLTLGPAVRDGGSVPFAVDVAGVAPRG